MILIVQDGQVVNAVVGSLETVQSMFPDALCVESEEGGIGWVWDGENLTSPPSEPPPVVVPAEVTMRQARLELLSAGKLSSVDAAIDAMPEPQRSAARIEWEYSSSVRRDNALILALGPALGMSEAQIDDWFVAAAVR